MNRRYAHVSRTALALLAAAGTIWLAAFFLPGAVVEPIPLLPGLGSTAVKVVAVPKPSTRKEVATPATTIATRGVARARLATATFVPRAAPAGPKPRPVLRPQRTRSRHPAPRPKHQTPVQKAAPAPATAAPSAAPVFYGAAPRGRAVGWHRKHDQVTAPAAAAPEPRHGNGHAKHDVPAVQPPPTAPVTPPSATPEGHDNGKHLGDEHGHGDEGHGPGGKR